MNAGQRDVLAHVVVDPDAWLSHAVEVFGNERAAVMLDNKAERWQDDYEAERARLGAAYQTRAEREAGN